MDAAVNETSFTTILELPDCVNQLGFIGHCSAYCRISASLCNLREIYQMSRGWLAAYGFMRTVVQHNMQESRR